MANTPRYTYFCRERGKIKAHYIGTYANPTAVALARRHRLVQAEIKAANKAKSVERNTHAKIDADLELFVSQLAALQKLWLQVQGYRVTTKGTLRRIKKRGPNDMNVDNDVTKDDIELLVKQAEKGDAEALHRLRSILWNDRETWRPFGDLSEHIRSQYFSLMTRGNIIAAESLRMSFAELANGLKQTGDGVLHDLVADEILICYLDFHYHQMLVTECRGTQKDFERLEKRLSLSQKRYHAARESLARINPLFPVEEDESRGSTPASAVHSSPTDASPRHVSPVAPCHETTPNSEVTPDSE